MKKDKQPIVALQRSRISKSIKNVHKHSSLLFSLKKNDLELSLYSGLDPELLRENLDKVL